MYLQAVDLENRFQQNKQAQTDIQFVGLSLFYV